MCGGGGGCWEGEPELCKKNLMPTLIGKQTCYHILRCVITDTAGVLENKVLSTFQGLDD